MTGSESTNNCGICFDALDKWPWQAHREKKLPCGHAFGNRCIERWTAVHPYCPYCRANIPPELSLAERVAERMDTFFGLSIGAYAFLVAFAITNNILGGTE